MSSDPALDAIDEPVVPERVPDSSALAVEIDAMADVLELAKSIVRGLPGPAVLIDLEFRPIEYNAQYLALCGIRRANLQASIARGCTAFELLGRTPESDLADARRAVSMRSPITITQEVVRNASGQRYTASLSFLPITGDGGEVLALIQIIRDETVESRLQQRYKELLRQERERANELEQKIKERTRELVSALEEVTRLSRTDPLTALLNRRAFVETAQRDLAVAERHERSGAVLIFDLDYFKRVNDRYGHQAGDAVLVSVADSLRRALRATDTIARFGGEEFVALLSEASAEDALAVANRCRRMVRSLCLETVVPGLRQPQTISIGVAYFPEHGFALDGLVQRADEALYFAKQAGRDRVVVYDPSLVATSTRPISTNMPRVLVVAPDPAQVQQYTSALPDSTEAVGCQSLAAAVSLCQHEQFDAIVLDEGISADRGFEFFVRTATMQPRACRMLLVASRESSLALPSYVTASVNCFLLREDAETHLAAALEDTRTRMEIELCSRPSRVALDARASSWMYDGIQRILREQAISFAYQPIVRLSDRSVFGYEALLRIQAGHLRDPEVVVDAAAQSQCVWTLGRMVRDIAARPLDNWADSLHLFINLHPDELEDPMLIERSPFADRVIFEITERAAISDYARLRSRIKELQKIGYRIAVDDLGGGYAGLSSVALLEPDFLKLDISVVHNIHESRSKLALARKMVDFANEVGIHIVAEGVEIKEEADAVKQLGFHLAQGFYYGKPMPLQTPARRSP